ncbi:MAG: DUF1631 family protein [Pseudomonas sp.]
MDKRQFARQSVSIDAQCLFGAGEEQSCRIRDFSQGGLLITLDHPLSKQAAAQLTDTPDTPAVVSFQLHNRREALQLLVAHVSEHGIGLRMRHYRPADIAVLRQAAQYATEAQSRLSWQPAKSQSALNNQQKINLIKAANGIVRRYLESHFEDFFKQLDGLLLQEADHKKTHATQQAFLDAITLFRAQRGRLIRGCIVGITANADDVAQGKGPPPLADTEQDSSGTSDGNALALVEKDEFEDWLVVRVSISKAEIQLRELLLELQLRLDAALTPRGATAVYNPYSPAAIAQGFSSVIRPMRLNNDLLRVIFHLFHDLVLSNLDSVYVALNKLLVDSGVLPDIDVTRYLAQQRMQREAAGAKAKTPLSVDLPDKDPLPKPPPVATAAPRPANNEKGVGRLKAAFSTVSKLLTVQRQLKDSDPQAIRSNEVAQEQTLARETHQALRYIQRNVLEGKARLDQPGALKQHLIEAGGAEGAITIYEQDSADMIESLFDNIVHNERVLEDLRSELRKLEVPILKVMLRDPSLFSADFHPARQAVNYLALLSDRRSINITDNKPVIIEAIKTILQSDDEDHEGFTQVLKGLDDLVAREKHFFERNINRVAEACEGQQRITRANLLIDWELRRVLAPQPVASPILDLVNHGWKELMRLSYFREGTSSLAWEMTLVVLDQLIVRTVPEEWDERRLRFSANKLIMLIGKGLSKIPDSGASHKTVIQNLEKLLDNPQGGDFPLLQYQDPLGEEQLPMPQDAAGADRSMQRWLKRAKGLKAGQWLERQSEGSESQLYYLAWIAEEHSRYVFSNHRGMKSEEMNLDQVASMLRDGHLSILNDASTPALEQGLDALVQKVYDKLALEAAQDQLTGLKTRREFLRWLDQSVVQAHEDKGRYALLFVDLMQFKLVNNTCGYAAGDALLREISEKILGLLDKDAIAGRVGVDQFAVLMPITHHNDGFLLAVALKAAIEEERFTHEEHSFIISSAVALINIDAKCPEGMELLRTVESAADMSKKSGHKDIQVIKPGDTRFRERDEVISWVNRINRSLDEGMLKVRCQKIAPIGDQDATHTHYEILLTVVDDNGEHLAPTDFIKAAEEFNRMGAVDRWVIETVLKWMVENKADLHCFGGFSINLSGCSLNDETFLDFIFETLVRFDVPREKLIFEITETAAIDNLADAADFINEMKEIGCRFSLDDFGAGQSSYAYLKRLPVDFIKIDGAFIRNIAEDNFDYALVKSITEMGHFLDKRIVAEYVSSPDILQLVTDIGVDYAQGYHVGRPILLDHLILSEPSLATPINPA